MNEGQEKNKQERQCGCLLYIFMKVIINILTRTQFIEIFYLYITLCLVCLLNGTVPLTSYMY